MFIFGPQCTIFLPHSSISGPALPVPAAGAPLAAAPATGEVSDLDDDADEDEESAEVAPGDVFAPTPAPAPAATGGLHFSDFGAPGMDPRRAAHASNRTPHWEFEARFREMEDGPLKYFLTGMPVAHIITVVLPATNAHLTKCPSHNAALTFGEFLRWLGVAMITATATGFKRQEYWIPSEDDLDGRPFITMMPHKRFENILSCLRLEDEDVLRAGPEDKFARVRQFIAAWNRNMDERFRPSYLTCLDESMVAWMEKLSCPGWVHVPRKPHPFGNEYHTIACAMSKIIFRLELVEGKDRPSWRPVPEFEDQLGKTGGLIMRMTEPLWHTGSVVVMDSAFCHAAAMRALVTKGVYSTSVVKKKRYWPKGIDGDRMDNELRDEPIGTAKCLRGEYDGEPFHLGGLRDSKHTLKLATTHGAMSPSPRIKRRRNPATGALVEFSYPDIVDTYYRARHAVDDNNHIRQGSMSLEREFEVRDWPKRQFLALTAISEANAYAFMNYDVQERRKYEPQANYPFDSLVAFRRELARQLIGFDASQGPTPEPSPKRLRSRHSEEHELVKAPVYTGRYVDGQGWTTVNTKYSKRTCAGPGCKKEIRTYCKCSRTKFWCSDCFYMVHMKSNVPPAN